MFFELQRHVVFMRAILNKIRPGGDLGNQVSRAEKLMLQGKFSKAALAWEEIISAKSRNMPDGVWAQLASAYRRTNNSDAALNVGIRASLAKVSTPDLHNEVVTALINAERESAAVKYLSDAARRISDPDISSNLLKRASDIENKVPTPATIIATASELMLKGEYEAAIGEWEAAIDLESPELPHGVWARLASAHRKIDNTQDVLDVASRAESHQAASFALYDEVATALVNAEREQEAIDFLVEKAALVKSKERVDLLSRATAIESSLSNIDISVRNLKKLIADYHSPLSPNEVKDAAAFTAKQAQRIQAQNAWEAYWNQRKNYVYLHVCRRLIEVIANSATSVADIGSNRSPILDYFGAKQTKYSVDIENPYVAEDVISITEDFYTWSPPEPVQVGTCFQVIEHVPGPAKFCRRMLEMFEVSIVSVPHLEPSGVNPGHINNDIDLAMLTSWFGRKPNFHYIAKELSGDERIICVFDRTTEDEFPDMHKEGKTAQDFMYRWSLQDFE